MVDGDIVRNEIRKEEEVHLPTKVCEDGTETIKKDEDEPRNKTSTETRAGLALRAKTQVHEATGTGDDTTQVPCRLGLAMRLVWPTIRNPVATRRVWPELGSSLGLNSVV